MTVKYFDSLSKRDFENGAVRDEIRETLKELEALRAKLEKIKRIANQRTELGSKAMANLAKIRKIVEED